MLDLQPLDIAITSQDDYKTQLTFKFIPSYKGSAESTLAANMPQDMPPTGGYEPVQYRRNLPVRGFRPVYYLAAVGAICTYGFYRVGQGIREQKYGRF
jgi:hypothetical protein